MIARLKGVVDELGPDWLVIDVAGVGYLVHASRRALTGLVVGAPVSLRIETHMREDAILLYGFADAREREWFLLLQQVQGVGVKLALAILSTLSPDQLQVAIAVGDKPALGRAPGVGPKLAARLANELKDKVAGLAMAPAAAGQPAVGDPVAADAVSALVHLGYGPSEAYGAVAAVRGRLQQGADLGAVIKAALKELAA